MALIERAGTNPTKVARDAGLNPHFVRQWLNGRVLCPGTRQLQAIADVLQVSLDELTRPSQVSEAVAAFEPRLPIRLAIGPHALLFVAHALRAGAWLEDAALTQVKSPVDAPRVLTDPRVHAAQWLELADDDSCDKVARQGSYVHAADAEDLLYRPRDGDAVILERVRRESGERERTLRIVERRHTGKIELRLPSSNARWGIPARIDAEGASEDPALDVRIVAKVIGVYQPMGGER